MDQDLRTGVEGVEIEIGFQADRIDEPRREGWSVLVQGPAHHVPDDEVATVSGAGVTPWAAGQRHLYIRIVPHQITGRRIHSDRPRAHPAVRRRTRPRARPLPRPHAGTWRASAAAPARLCRR
ncbi:pyridoxamine 5'-phosphate oxidase family protein [Nonomuraea rubra]|uniref:pyridoxamine 5'-phosphate oxidase family protein n=1 Tax=Nonomuraea rubra TaxID=46180 RepID=UPI003F4CD5E2